MGGAYQADRAWSVLFENPHVATGGTPKTDWIGLELEGTTANRAALGARVTVRLQTPAGPRRLHRIVSTGGSFGSSPLPHLRRARRRHRGHRGRRQLAGCPDRRRAAAAADVPRPRARPPLPAEAGRRRAGRAEAAANRPVARAGRAARPSVMAQRTARLSSAVVLAVVAAASLLAQPVKPLADGTRAMADDLARRTAAIPPADLWINLNDKRASLLGLQLDAPRSVDADLRFRYLYANELLFAGRYADAIAQTDLLFDLVDRGGPEAGADAFLNVLMLRAMTLDALGRGAELRRRRQRRLLPAADRGRWRAHQPRGRDAGGRGPASGCCASIPPTCARAGCSTSRT